jgi:hypothetical protein
MSETVGASTSRNPKDLHGLYRENFSFTFTGISFCMIREKLIGRDMKGICRVPLCGTAPEFAWQH